MAKVYFYSGTANLKKGFDKFLEMIAEDMKKNLPINNLPIDNINNNIDNIGVKIHFGEEGNDTHINPKLLTGLKDSGFFKNPKFIECNVLYKGSRTTTADHLKTAKRHGFGFLDIDILDGEFGQEYIEVPVNTELTKNALLGKGLRKYKNLICISHVKGHAAVGFGGALKNLGMGLGSREGKMRIHCTAPPFIKKESCTGCGACIGHCNENAIEIADGKADIDKSKCISCVHCIAFCPHGAIWVDWSSGAGERLMEKIADYSSAAAKGRSWQYINFLINITYECDCVSKKQKPFMKDIGILYSKDPVAIDMASFDIIKKAFGKDPFKEKNNINSMHLLECAERLGVGKKEYELVSID